MIKGVLNVGQRERGKSILKGDVLLTLKECFPSLSLKICLFTKSQSICLQTLKNRTIIFWNFFCHFRHLGT